MPADTRVWLHTPPLEPPGHSLLGVPRPDPRVARTAPRPRQVRDLIIHGPQLKWVRQMIKEGSKGPLVAEFAFLRVTVVRDGLPGPHVWLMVHRTLGPKPKIQFYFNNAPTPCPLSEFIRVSELHWPVETTLEEGKGEVGLDHNETRTWPGWHHHLSHAFLAQLFCPCPRPLAGVGRCVIHLRVHWPSRAHDRAGPPAHRPSH